MKTLLCILLICFFSECRTQNQKVEILKNNDIVDSFQIINLNNQNELGNLSFLSDSIIVSLGSGSNELRSYKIENKSYIPYNKKTIESKSSIYSFFIENNGCLNYINTEKEWFRLDSLHESPEFFKKIELKFDSLKDSYRFFTAHNYPAISFDSSVILRVCEISPPDYFKAFSEKSLCRLYLNDSELKKTEYLFEKPKILKEHYEVYPLYCYCDGKIILIYPCIDSIYSYDLITKKYSCYPIKNSFYSIPEKYDHNKFNQPDYRTIMRLNNFRYTGIMFNPSTNNFVLYYLKPVDKRIKVPTFDDQKIHALILNKDFKTIKHVEFLNKYRTPGSYLITKKGIAMPTFKYKYAHDTTYSFHIYNF